MAVEDPKFKEKIKNNPLLKFGAQNLYALLIPEYFQMAQNILPKKNQMKMKIMELESPNLQNHLIV